MLSKQKFTVINTSADKQKWY